MFANQAKRNRFNYEEVLADSYTNNPNVTPGGGSVANAKKRRASSSSSSQLLLEEKRGCFQQYMETGTLNLKDALAMAQTPEQVMVVAAEYERVRRQMEVYYDPPTGDAMGCGSDEALALGITDDADQDKLIEYPPTFCLLPQGTPEIVQVFAGGMHSGVLTVDGRVLTFGQNDDGALGREVTADDLHLAGEVRFPPSAHGRIIQVDAGDNYTIFLTMEGKVYFCGTMKDVDSGKFAPTGPGQVLKNGTRQATPMEMNFPQLISKISAGDNAAAALGVDGTLYTFGMGHIGELGRSKSMGAELIKIERPGEPSYMAYELGKTFIGDTVKKMETKKKDGKIVQEEVEEYVYNTKLIAQKFMTPAPVEFERPDDYTVLDMAMGQTHMIVVARTPLNETKVFATGLNQYGQLGLGDTKNRHCLTEITAFRGKDTIYQVAVGAFHTLFLNSTGTAIYSCGRSDYGQLGLSASVQGAGAFVMEPTQVPFPESTKGQRFSKITAGDNTCAAILDSGDIYTWGYNTCAQTGHACKARGPEQSEDILVPTKLDPLRAYKRLNPEKGTTADVLGASCGGQHSLFLIKRYAK